MIETIQRIADGADRYRAIEANGILSGITAFNFVICYNNVFHVTAKLSDKLQAESLDLGSELVSFYHG